MRCVAHARPPPPHLASMPSCCAPRRAQRRALPRRAGSRSRTREPQCRATARRRAHQPPQLSSASNRRFPPRVCARAASNQLTRLPLAAQRRQRRIQALLRALRPHRGPPPSPLPAPPPLPPVDATRPHRALPLPSTRRRPSPDAGTSAQRRAPSAATPRLRPMRQAPNAPLPLPNALRRGLTQGSVAETRTRSALPPPPLTAP
eukprot:3364150-Pleurochrysis_carterae.AAC.1